MVHLFGVEIGVAKEVNEATCICVAKRRHYFSFQYKTYRDSHFGAKQR
jgi:hypothetical protein